MLDLKRRVTLGGAAIATAIQDVLDFVCGKTFIQCDRALPTYLVLVPLVYLRHRFPTAWKTAKDMDRYLLQCSLATAFGGQPDSLLDAPTRSLDPTQQFNVERAFDVVRAQGRSLQVTQDRLWRMGYGSSTMHLLFNLWYRDFNHTPAYASARRVTIRPLLRSMSSSS